MFTVVNFIRNMPKDCLKIYEQLLERIEIYDNGLDYYVKTGKHWYECNTICFQPNGVAIYIGTTEPINLGAKVDLKEANINLIHFGLISLLEEIEEVWKEVTEVVKYHYYCEAYTENDYRFRKTVQTNQLLSREQLLTSIPDATHLGYIKLYTIVD